MARTKLFIDFEFTGLVKQTTPISLGIAAEDGRCFYAEFTDYDKSMCDTWIETNVIQHLGLEENAAWPGGVKIKSHFIASSQASVFIGSKEHVTSKLLLWLEAFYPGQEFEIWLDTGAYDWVLFCDLFGGALYVPKNIFYIPFDIATLMRDKLVDPDISRQEYAGMGKGPLHNALWDAMLIRACYFKLTDSDKKDKEIDEHLQNIQGYIDKIKAGSELVQREKLNGLFNKIISSHLNTELFDGIEIAINSELTLKDLHDAVKAHNLTPPEQTSETTFIRPLMISDRVIAAVYLAAQYTDVVKEQPTMLALNNNVAILAVNASQIRRLTLAAISKTIGENIAKNMTEEQADKFKQTHAKD